MKRRTLLGLLLSLTGLPIAIRYGFKRWWTAPSLDLARLRADLVVLSKVLLPSSLTPSMLDVFVTDLLDWVNKQKPGGGEAYHFMRTPGASVPFITLQRYAENIADLKEDIGSPSLNSVSQADVSAHLTNQFGKWSTSKVLDNHPTGQHVCLDILALFYSGPLALDVMYGRKIGQFGCRGLGGVEADPVPLGLAPK